MDLSSCLINRTELFAIVDDFGPNQDDHVNIIRTLSAAQTIIVDASQTARARIANFSQFETVSASLNQVQFDEVSQLSLSDYSDLANGNAELIVKDTEHRFRRKLSTRIRWKL